MRATLLLFLFSLSLTLISCDGENNSSKVTDPTNPSFNKYEFLWSDYRGATDLVEVFRVILPKGTPREEVEKILLNDPNAKISEDVSFEKFMERIGAPKIDSYFIKMNSDPDFMSSKRMVSYVGPVENAQGFLSMNKSDWTTRVFYDSNNQVNQISVYQYPVHLPSEES